MKIRIKNVIVFTIFFIINLFLTNKVFAATLTLTPSKESLGIGEQFYIDLMLDTGDEPVNTISGKILFPSENVSFVRAEDGKSIVNLWVEKPEQKNNEISFTGVMLGGFNGVIDPFNQRVKLPGLIIRLVFEAKTKSEIHFSSSVFSLSKHDGLGTEIQAPSVDCKIIISDVFNHYNYENSVASDPELEAYIINDININNNKYTLIFKATDKETGIKSVKIKEGQNDWKEIESPYTLLDQSRHSDITLQAMNFSGSGIIVNINGEPYDREFLVVSLFLIILILVLLFLIIKRIYNKKKYKIYSIKE